MTGKQAKNPEERDLIRIKAAERFFQQADLGDTEVVATGAWEYEFPQKDDDEIARAVFVKDGHSDEASRRVHFVARFDREDRLVSARLGDLDLEI